MKAITTTFEPDWDTKHRKALDRLEELRQQRGIALMEGKTFDNRLINVAESDVDACAAAREESVRRHREKAEERFRIHTNDQKTRLLTVVQSRQESIVDAEAALTALADALDRYLSTSKEACQLINGLGGSFSTISDYEVRRRAAIRISLSMKPLTGTASRFGGIEFINVSPEFVLGDGTSPHHSWAEADAIKIAADVAKVLQEKITDEQH